MPQRVSLCIIARNEEANLPGCLDSAAGLVQEVVVVDTGSTDRTRAIATRYGARVYDFPWVDDFAAARNQTLRHATGDWIFWLDADDRVDEPNRQLLRQLFAGLRDENAVYLMRCLSGEDPAQDEMTVVVHARLFRKHPEVCWKYRVHEQILPSLEQLGSAVRLSNAVIRHVGYQDPEVQRRKQERSLRLLEMDRAEHPDDPVILFNLGRIYHERGRHAEALTLLHRTVDLTPGGHSLLATCHALLIQAHARLGEKEQALAACQAGRDRYPDDPVLLFQHALLLEDAGDAAAAEACFLRSLERVSMQHTSQLMDVALGGKARHRLATMYFHQGRAGEAEAQWRAVVAERPGQTAAWMGLADIWLAQGRFHELQHAAERLQAAPGGTQDAALLRARVHLARREFGLARPLLEQRLAADSRAFWPRVALAHLLLVEGRDPAAAERALREVLALDPSYGPAQEQLNLLLQRQGRPQPAPGASGVQGARPDPTCNIVVGGW